MSDNVLALFGGNALPAHLRNNKDELTSKLAGPPAGIKRISIRGSVFRLMDGSQEIAAKDERYMDFVVVAASDINRTYYPGQYNEAEKTKPVCWSNDGRLPASEVAEPQAKSCATCPRAVKNAEGRAACRFSQRLAIALPNDTDPDAVYQLSVPAASIFGKEETANGTSLQHYGRQLAGHAVPVSAVVTRATFDTRSATPKLMFKAVSALNAADFEHYKEIGAGEDAARAVAFTVSQADGVSDAEEFAPAPTQAPAPAPARAAQRRAPAPVAEAPAPVAESEDIPEPIVRKASPTPAPAPVAESGVADLLEEWGDE